VRQVREGDVMSRLLTAEELAERWQVPTGWIYAKCRSGELPKVPLPGKYVRFRLDVVERFERGELDPTNEGA
jgi:predicted DNA-binding transcriptional regulator AlpA